MRPTPPPRLSLVRAERAPVAVIFRRGPSKRVEVVKWDFTRDSFERGHWFHGRIYDKRSHLSPDGELLVYFASKFTRHSISDDEYTYAWTAVSRAPWLTALALWPKGDCWHGGGIFLAKRTLWLNHKPEVATPHPSHRPIGLKVVDNPGARGEDEPVYEPRLDRDGWLRQQEWSTEWQGLSRGFRTIQPDIRVKHQQPGTDSIAITLQRRIDNLSYREHFRVDGASSEPDLPPGPLDWLDWDSRGRLIALSGGRVWAAAVVERHVQRFTELIDLRDDRPEEREPPAWARIW